MAPRSGRASGHDTDTSMAEDSEPIRQLPVDPMVCVSQLRQLVQSYKISYPALYHAFLRKPDIDLLLFRTLMKLRITPKTRIRIPTPPPAVLLGSLWQLMAEDEDQRQRNCAGVSLARNMIVLVNRR
jgi:hypothetical protein